ncbi:hypothetical protein Clacol_002562 [Clathrus columnatus]|uniref:Amino acid transporter transmembrane domain-containing protein n=1 Tax=Clathrus columnatus TaxID=1419009 RepID=A0AAV5A5R5_9AGAM|nr:hypothetical protein Clacol_002562 [Clathrus columnatus]
MTSPSTSKPVFIGSPRNIQNDVFETNVTSQNTPIGTPDIRVIRSSGRFSTPPLDLPPRHPGQDTPTPPGSFQPRGLLARRGSTTPSVNPGILDELSDADKAKIIRRHLVSREERNSGEGSRQDYLENLQVSHPSTPRSSDRFPIPYDVPGGDITHDIYKWQSGTELRRTRSISFSGPSAPKDPVFENIRQPGGFRRNYLLLNAREPDVESEIDPNRSVMLRNFIDFLYLFGHFAGEDLEEEDEETMEPQATARTNNIEHGTVTFENAPTTSETQGVVTEESPLIKRDVSKGSTRRRPRRMSSAVGEPHGDASVTQAVLMLLKGFVGTGVLFLGKAFMNGGLLFATLILVFIAAISWWSFMLLVKTKLIIPGSFGDIGGALYGHPMRIAILTSIVVSQIGFTCAYIIFVASNFQAFLLTVSRCKTVATTLQVILSELIILLPMALIRNIAKLSTAALIADVFILIGLVYIFGNEISVLATNGVADIKQFNSHDWTLLVGTAVFSFEGIGLVIPIADSMREPHKFGRALSGVMIFLTVLFAGAGVLAYTAYGSKVQTVIILNLPQEQKFVQVLFPGVRIMENGLFTRSGKHSLRVKWQKNAFRCLVVAVCTVVSWLGAADLDNGTLLSVPLCYVYPPMLHYKACARTKLSKCGDILLIIFGIIATVFTTVQTVKLMFESPTEAIPIGSCPEPSGGLL